MPRISIVDGIFYPADFQQLEIAIRNCFLSKFGPKELPKERTNKKIYGVIVPHAGYQFSGPCAAFAYKAIAESKFPKRYILLGVNHNLIIGRKFALSSQDWQTPFGIVKTDQEYIKKLESCKDSKIRVDEALHRQEHSIEVQLPFLQFVSKDKLHELRIVPITVSEASYEEIKKTASCFTNDSVVIISSDFTHYGPMYGYVLPTTNPKQDVEKLDKEAIELILNFKTKEFLEYTEDKTICGRFPIALGLEILKKLGAGKAELLSYYTSAEISSNDENFVGYATIVFT